MIVAGARIGTLCVLDREPHGFPSRAELDQLKALAGLAASLFTLKDATRSGAIAEAALAREENDAPSHSMRPRSPAGHGISAPMSSNATH